MVVRNSLAGGLGAPYFKRASIPQGCPLSMMITALLLRPWILLIRERGVKPRVLADDTFIAAKGEAHLHAFKTALNITHEYPKDMVAHVAPDMSTNFSNHKDAREWLAQHTWKEVGECIPVKTNQRDLGAHICTLEFLRGSEIGTSKEL